jgi:hypothetical protein
MKQRIIVGNWKENPDTLETAKNCYKYQIRAKILT